MGAMNRETAGLPRSVDQRINFRGAVAAERDLLRDTLSARQRGPMVGGIMDTTTGQVFTGINTEPIGAIHPALQPRLAGLEPPFHGEINALNKALWARGAGAQIDDSFMLYNLRFGKGGIPISPCPTCQGVTQGVFPLSFGVK
jgi:hypothetical protein